LTVGDLYFKTGSGGGLRVYNGSAWVAAAFDVSGALINTNNLSDVSNAATALANLGVSSTAAEVNQLDAITRGSIIYGNASAATARLAKGGAGTVLTSDGTDIAWAAGGGAAFAGSTVTITGDTTLANSQKGNLFQCTSGALVTLPASTAGMFFIITNASTSTVEVVGNNNQLVGGTSALRQIAIGGAIIVMGTGSAWQVVGVSTETQGLATTYNASATHTVNSKTKAILVCAFGATAASSYGNDAVNERSGGTGGGNYSEKFIASPASSYQHVIGAGTSAGGSANNTTVAGMTLPGGPPALAGGNGGNTVARAPAAAGSGGDVNFTGGLASAVVGNAVSGGGGGSASRAGNGGNASANKNNASGTSCGGGGTGGNNAPTSTPSGNLSVTGAAATSRNSNTRNCANFGVVSETWAPQVSARSVNLVEGGGAGLPGYVDMALTFGSTFRIGNLTCGQGTRGAEAGANQTAGEPGCVTYVEFFENE